MTYDEQSLMTIERPSLASVARRAALARAWKKVRANRGGPGIDAISLKEFERNLEVNLAELSRNLVNRTYEPLPARRVMVPKTNGKQRELAIPAVRDRVAQRAVLDAIEPLFEPQFLDCSYAFRPGRSTEMAVQQILVARARGYRWVVDADIHDFFPTIDNRLLMGEVAETVEDADLLHLIEQWLESGALAHMPPRALWGERWRSSIASAEMAVRDTVNDFLDGYVHDRLGASASRSMEDGSYGEEVDGDGDEEEGGPARQPLARRSGLGRVVLRRFVEDGLLFAIAQRSLLRGASLAKVLGIGGAAVAALTLAPAAIRKLRDLPASRAVGTLQGAPISPLLSNIYLHPFDLELQSRQHRLVRYCDDFLVLCQSEAEARSALEVSRAALDKRRLQLSAEKTDVRGPSEGFTFLGYEFNPNGGVLPPPGIPDVVKRRVIEFALRTLDQTRNKLEGVRVRGRIHVKEQA